MKSWSQLIKVLLSGLFFLPVSIAGAQQLLISEIMYHPAPGTNVFDAEEYEFIEIYNSGASPINLTQAYFSDGIEYTFSNLTGLAAGHYMAITKNPSAFTERYPDITNTAPYFYEGQLANSGERVTLKDSGGITLCTVSYSDDYEKTDGHGASLFFANQTGDPDEATNWCVNAQLHGNPGRADTCSVNRIVINEILAHTDTPLEDAVELFNLTTNSMNLSGWYLSDNVAIRKKYQLTNSIISAGGYLVLYESQFAATNLPGNTPFSLSELGDEVYLTAADPSSNLTDFIDYHVFEASENSYSFGRYVNGTGALVTLAARSLGSSNGLPRVGPVVISEIMYHPPNDDFNDEYIELLNTSTGTVSLYDTVNPTNTWKIAGAIEFTFPEDVELDINERLIVTGSSNLSLFVETHGMDTNVIVLGPWDGKLNNAGEDIRLYKPGNPETNLTPYILVENIDYLDESPWPAAADGNGPSLERLYYTNYGNTAENWFAGAPGGSPGTAPVAGLINGELFPSPPVPGLAFTATVSIVAEALPTQVVFITEVGGISSNWVMRDDGTGGDLASGDQIYTAVIDGQADNQWVYYNFRAYSTNGSIISAPPPETEYVDAPSLTLQIAYDGLETIVEPQEAWITYEAYGTASHTQIFDVFLNGSGEVLVDDISVRDTATQTERATGGDFSAPIPTWRMNGNHSNSYREILSEENDNGVLHVVSDGVGASYNNAVGFSMTPPLTPDEYVSLSFRARLLSEEKDQWHWVAIGTPPSDVVINEIMYHSAATNEDAYEYVELYNPSDTAFDLSLVELNGAAFTLAEDTWLAPSSFVVCCASTGTIYQEYSITNIVGNFGGRLQNSGEKLTLRNKYGREFDSVDYNDKHPWPEAPDGYGPSLERCNIQRSSSNTYNWAASHITTNWIFVSWTGEISSANSGLSFFLDYDGKCWIDDVSVTPLGGGGEMVPNDGYELGMAGWSATGNHWRSRIEPGTGRSGSNALAVAGTFSRFVFPGQNPSLIINHGDPVSNRVSSMPLMTTNGDNYVVSLWVKPRGVSGALNIVYDDNTNRIDLGCAGTPGIQNSRAGQFETSEILDVDHVYDQLNTGQTNIITAELGTTDITTVDLRYRLVTTNNYEFTDHEYTSIPMLDDGVGPDSTAGDGIYSLIGPEVTSIWTLVRYHVEVRGTNGILSRHPRSDDPSSDYGYWVNGYTAQTNLPNWHLLIDGNPVLYPVAARGCAVSPDGQVFIDSTIRHRGGPSVSDRRGLALRLHRATDYDAWFANDQGGINFRHRRNNSQFYYRRVINEPIAYGLQRAIGIPTPRLRHITLWIDGEPTITTELEDPGEAYVRDNNIDPDDLLTRSGNAGRRIISGDDSLNNLWTMLGNLDDEQGSNKTTEVRNNLNYESIRYVLGFLSAAGNVDQNISWNMFQHRVAEDGRWQQYPWDVDICFVPDDLYNPPTTNLHPYFATPLHISGITDNTNGAQLARTLFYPETGSNAIYTLPYRHRQQMTLWRYCYTLLTTNHLHPQLDTLENELLPVYQDLGLSTYRLTNQVQAVKDYITYRRDFLINQSWSDKNTNIWLNPQYDPATVVINEIMPNPVSGGEYLELYNTSTQTIDLSWWTLSTDDEVYHLPHGTMLGSTSYLVIADTQSLLTNSYAEISDSENMIHRHNSTPIWDGAIIWTSATEYASRIIEIPQLTLPAAGTQIILTDLQSNIIDTVTYTNTAPWPEATGISLELIKASSDNTAATNWRLCSIIGTPGTKNSAAYDVDDDVMEDDWEQTIINASGGLFSNIYDIAATEDFDVDGIPNYDEYILGTDPTVQDAGEALIDIESTNSLFLITMLTKYPMGPSYQIYSNRLYTFEEAQVLTHSWAGITNYMNINGNGQLLVFTNSLPAAGNFYRGLIRLVPVR